MLALCQFAGVRIVSRPGEVLLKVSGVTKVFDVSPPWLTQVLAGQGRLLLRAVDAASFEIRHGETLGLVGESGCGKSTVARLVVGLYAPTSGTITFDGTSVAALSEGGRNQALRRKLQMIFQDPYASLNPRWRVVDIVAEPIRAHRLLQGSVAIRARVDELLTQVGLAAADGQKYPHQFSGGQRQRISIARALASAPEFLVCDEPTSALDVSVQAQVLNMMRDLQREMGLTYLFISHDLSVVRYLSNHIGVMYLGKLVEIGTADEVYLRPAHPYTKGLIESAPTADPATERAKVHQGITGELPSAIHPPSGCRFRTRCPLAQELCSTVEPELKTYGAANHLAACHFALQPPVEAMTAAAEQVS
jgi:peptide/nickel transport system ATP-binding protein